MKTRSTSRASDTPATPPSPPVASAGPDRYLLTALLLSAVLASCQSPHGSLASTGRLRYSVKKNAPPPGGGANAHFVVEASVPSKGSQVESHILVVYDAKWVTLSLGEAQESGREFEVSEEGDEPIPAEVGKFTGLILAVRCRDAKEGRTDTDFRIYRIKDGKVIGRERSTSSLAAGELKELALP